MKRFRKIIPFALFFCLLMATCILSGCAFSNKFRVKFYVGNELYYVVKSQGNEIIKAPDDPQVDGYNFEGWYFDSALTQAYDESFAENEALTTNISIYAKLSLTTFNITYESNGGSSNASNPSTYTIESDNLLLHPVQREYYSFDGWYTESTFEHKVTSITTGTFGNLTLYAKWIGQEYTITYVTNGGVNATNNPTKFNYDSGELLLNPAQKDYYDFLMWYSLNASSGGVDMTTLQTANYHENITIYAIWTPTTYHATGMHGNNTYLAGYNYNSTIGIYDFNIESTSIDLPEPSFNYYDFAGWYLEPTFDNSVTTIPAHSHGDYNIYAKFTPTSYHITYNLNGGNLGAGQSNPSTYTILDSFTLCNPTKVDGSNTYEFLAWEGTGLVESSNIVTIPAGSHEDRTYTAYYYDSIKNLDLYADGRLISHTTFFGGKVIDLDALYNAETLGMSGYIVNDWYTNNACTELFDKTSKLYDDTTLYGKFEYLFDYINFYKYLSDFNLAQTTLTLDINSRDELVAYVDYVRFYNISNEVALNLTYYQRTSNEMMEEVNQAYTQLLSHDYFATSSTITTRVEGLYGHMRTYYYVTSSTWDYQATLVYDQEKDYVYPQYDYVFKMGNPLTRANDYDDFNINNLSLVIPNISTTEQLIWVLENGYKPSFVASSVAEDMYNKAKIVLRNIIDNSMTNLEKVRAIYEWLIMNVQYDNYAFDLATNSNPALSVDELKTHDSWFVEGVLNNQKAVCEGIAKTLLLMARIENIPTIFVTGNGHAWNKVYIDGVWYGIDATHGNVELGSDGEFLSYDNFMFTDEFKESLYYSTTDFASITATTTFDFYTYYTFSGTSYDLVMNDREELKYLLQQVKVYVTDLTCDKVTIEVAFLNSSDLSSWINYARIGAGLNSNPSYTTINTQNDDYYVYALFFDLE